MLSREEENLLYKMVVAGTLEIIGLLNTTEIERGTNKIESSFKDIKAVGDNTTSSMNRLFGVTGNIANSVATLGAIGVSALAGLAAFAPQTAGALASIGATTKQLSLIVGEELAPAFDAAAVGYSNFVSFLAGDTGMSNFVKEVGWLVGASGLGLLVAKMTGGVLASGVTIPIALSLVIAYKEDDIKSFIEEKLNASGTGTAESNSKDAGVLASVATYSAIGMTLGAGAGLLGGPLAPVTVPAGIAGGFAIGATIGWIKGMYDNFWSNKNEQILNSQLSGMKNSSFMNLDTLGVGGNT